MPRIPDHVVDCVVYLYPDEVAANEGRHAGGSGFIIGIPLIDVDPAFTHPIPAVVTNRHVINGGNLTVRFNTVTGPADPLSLTEEHWIKSETDDLAICLLPIDGSVHPYHYVEVLDFATAEIVDRHKIGLGDDIFMVGRFIHHDGTQRNAPSVRFGNIAQMPGEKIRFDDGSEQESYLVEARSIPGYSGSPVFVHILPFMGGSERRLTQESFGPWLLGVDHCHIHTWEPVIDKATGRATSNWHVKGNTGMMGVVPAWKLIDLIESPRVKAQTVFISALARQVVAEKRAKTGATRDAAEPAAPTSDENLQHKEAFTRLVRAASKPKK